MDCKEEARGEPSCNLELQGRGQRRTQLQLGTAMKRPEEDLAPTGDCKEEARGGPSSNYGLQGRGQRRTLLNLELQGRGQRRTQLQLGTAMKSRTARKRPKEDPAPTRDCNEEARGGSSSNWGLQGRCQRRT